MVIIRNEWEKLCGATPCTKKFFNYHMHLKGARKSEYVAQESVISC